ncbi:MAG: hypothetical protein DDT39_01687 [Firmicutes bacterium]|nr:hypothetical protein [candidate division NPL-UPA2 bacterium]
MPDSSVDQQKEVEFYAASVAGWINTSLEHDKSLLALSAGGLGLLLTLLIAFGVENAALLVLYVSAILSFLSAVIATLAIFHRNKVHIQRVLGGEAGTDPRLGVLDKFSVASFALGAIFTTIIALSTAVASFTNKERSMASSSKPAGTVEHLGKSLNGLGGLRPQPANSPASQAPATPASQSTTPAPSKGVGSGSPGNGG